MKAMIGLIFVMCLTVPAMADDWLHFDYETGQFKADFSQRQAGLRAFEQEDYAKAMVLFKQSYQAVPTQKTLTYFAYALDEMDSAMPIFDFVINKTMNIHSPQPLQNLLANNQQILPLFLFTRWQPDCAVTHLPLLLQNHLANTYQTLTLKSFSGQKQSITLPQNLHQAKKPVMSILGVPESGWGIRQGIYQQVEQHLLTNVTLIPVSEQDKIVRYEQLLHAGLIKNEGQMLVSKQQRNNTLWQGYQLRMHMEVVDSTVSNNQIEAEVYVAMLDLVGQKALAVKAFFAQADNKQLLQGKLAQDIALFATTFEPDTLP